jgi:hypothetical protein
LALALFVPHLLWQRAHGWPTLEFMANAERTKNVHLGLMGFATGQLGGLHPFNAILALLGLVWLLAAPSASRFRPLAWIYLAAFALFALRNGKPYYLYAGASTLLAAGAVALEQVADVGRRRWARVAAPLLLVDEPANHLDPAQQIDVYRLLGELWQQGSSVVCVTHDVNLLRHLGNPGQVRVAGVAQGKLRFECPLTAPELPQKLGELFGMVMHTFTLGGHRLLLPERSP